MWELPRPAGWQNTFKDSLKSVQHSGFPTLSGYTWQASGGWTLRVPHGNLHAVHSLANFMKGIRHVPSNGGSGMQPYLKAARYSSQRARSQGSQRAE